MKRWFWLHLTRAGRDELNATRRYWASIERALADPAAVVCNGCGASIVTVWR